MVEHLLKTTMFLWLKERWVLRGSPWESGETKSRMWQGRGLNKLVMNLQRGVTRGDELPHLEWTVPASFGYLVWFYQQLTIHAVVWCSGDRILAGAAENQYIVLSVVFSESLLPVKSLFLTCTAAIAENRVWERAFWNFGCGTTLGIFYEKHYCFCTN